MFGVFYARQFQNTPVRYTYICYMYTCTLPTAHCTLQNTRFTLHSEHCRNTQIHTAHTFSSDSKPNTKTGDRPTSKYSCKIIYRIECLIKMSRRFFERKLLQTIQFPLSKNDRAETSQNRRIGRFEIKVFSIN